MTWAPTGGFVLRSPVLPFSVLERIVGAADPVVAPDAELRRVVAEPIVREAIHLASPSLDERIEGWLAGTDTDPAATARSALSYVSRMAFRPTPFGLFAGCSVGETGGDKTTLDLAGAADGRRHTRLDFGFLARLVATLAAEPESRRHLTFVANSSLYRAGGRLRMVETRIDEHRRVRYHRVTFEEDDALRSTLDRAAPGARIDDLAASLAAELADDGVTMDEGAEYVGQLVDSQVLVPSIEPAITGPEGAPGLVSALAQSAPTTEVAEILDDVIGRLATLDAAGPGAGPATFVDLVERLRKADPDLDPARLFQADLVSPPVELSLGPKVIREMTKAVEVLHRITTSGGEDDLSSFRARFRARYDDRQLPLVEVLDEELGIGFGTASGAIQEGGPLLAGMTPGSMLPDQLPGPSWTALDAQRLRLLQRTLLDGGDELVLTARDVKELETATGDRAPLPDAFSVTATIAAVSADEVDAGNFQLVGPSVAGPSGARMLGRFCHADPATAELVTRHLEGEEAAAASSGAVFAEIVHLPEGRAGNVLARPVLRSFEIPFLGRSGAAAAAQIPVDDLLVSVVGDRIVLRSSRLDVEVIPRMTTAHNHLNSALAIYRFLASLVFQGVAAGLQWRWGPLEASPFLPRVVHGRLVLARARWLLLAKDIEGLIEAKDSVGRAGALAGLRARHRLPAWVVVTSADHQLPIWLDGDAGVDLLVHEGRQSGSLTLTELLPEPDRLVVQRPEGRVNHEVVVPFVAPPTSPVSGRSVATVAGDPAPRTFAPGSVWVSAKLYTGKATADAGLRDAVAPLVDALRADGAIDGWFFLRYGDPDWHLRVRLHASASDRAPEVAAAVGGATQAMLDDGRISRIVLDTYNREVERYGGSDGVALSERVFEADSDAALAIVEAAGGEDGLDARWRLALVGVDRLLTDFGMGLDERRPLVRSWATALEAEHGRGGLEARRWAGRLFRSERGPLQRLLTGDGSGLVPEITAGFDALARRSGALAPVVADLRAAADRGRLTTSLVALANSYCHMHVNRVLRASQRVQELVIYDLLDRAYQAQRARGRA